MVGEVGIGAGERVDGMVNGTDHTPRHISGLGASRGGRIMGSEIGVSNEFAEVSRFAGSDRGWFSEEVLG